MRCACCKEIIHEGDTTGESGLYSPDRKFTLCESCWLLEDEYIDETGTNVHPDKIEWYKRVA